MSGLGVGGTLASLSKLTSGRLKGFVLADTESISALRGVVQPDASLNEGDFGGDPPDRGNPLSPLFPLLAITVEVSSATCWMRARFHGFSRSAFCWIAL